MVKILFNLINLNFIKLFLFQIPEHTLPLLVNLIEGQIKNMRTIIEHVHNKNCQWSESFQQKIDTIHEDIHWMFLIAGINLWLVQLF